MADEDEEHGGGGGSFKVTDNTLAAFSTEKLAKLIEAINTSVPVSQVRAYGTGGTPFRAGNNSGAFGAPDTLEAKVKDYAGSIDALMKTVVDQLNTLIVDLQLADRYLTNARDEALDYAQFMRLAERTLNPGTK
ncbi:hypothetical protein ACFP3U_27405 [Kitasatospora misakiensis]|uniref:Uncharacterized protein n=1 Tax=Kitasatospora misakiensis TaxID=67330 RepID=A0ABW0X8B2_9ACTN